MKADSTSEGILEFGTRRIAYRLIRGQRKRVRIAITPDMAVTVSAPVRARDAQIEELLHKKAHWIVRTLDRIKTFHPLPAPKQYVSGETMLYLGRQYRLKVEQGEPAPARLKGRFLLVNVANKGDATAAKRAVENWYRIRAEETFRRYLEKCTEVTARHGVPSAEITLRKMQTRWGSCSSKGRVTINTNLIQAPVHCIEYVIMHELCHLKHHNHSKAFYHLLSLCMPDWPKRKEALHRVVIPRDK
jgi:predicted metal-dependent hydrolase